VKILINLSKPRRNIIDFEDPTPWGKVDLRHKYINLGFANISWQSNIINTKESSFFNISVNFSANKIAKRIFFVFLRAKIKTERH
jgi:hypothetical protein